MENLRGSLDYYGRDPSEYDDDGRLGTTPTPDLVAADHEREKVALAAAYNSGRADERRDVLAWLHRQAEEAEPGDPRGVATALAEDIEALAHHPGPAEHVLSPDCWCKPVVEEVPGR